MKKFIAIFITAAVLAAVFAGCGRQPAPVATEDDNKLNIVATVFPAYDFARAIAGDRAKVTMLIKPGASIHSFDPSPSDMKTINGADIFIYIGGESESWVDRILSSIDVSGKTLVRLIGCVNVVEEEFPAGMEPEDEETVDEPSYDEHIWTSPQNAITLIRAISDAFCALDAENAGYYRRNADGYIADIQKLDNEIRGVVKDAKRSKIVVADKFPFRYFVDEYGLSYCAAFPACSDQSDASIDTIANLVNTVKNDGIPYIYYVELSTQNVAKAVGEETGAGLLLLNSCHNVSKSDFEAGATYLSLMAQNLENLRKGLN